MGGDVTRGREYEWEGAFHPLIQRQGCTPVLTWPKSPFKQYLVPWARYGTPNPIVLDEGARKELWTWLEKQVEKFEGQ